MQLHQSVIDAILNIIRANGNNEIEPSVHAPLLTMIVQTLGRYEVQTGKVSPLDSPTAGDRKLYFASSAGSYPNFNGIQVAEGELCYFTNPTGDEWVKTVMAVIPTETVGDIIYNYNNIYSRYTPQVTSEIGDLVLTANTMSNRVFASAPNITEKGNRADVVEFIVPEETDLRSFMISIDQNESSNYTEFTVKVDFNTVNINDGNIGTMKIPMIQFIKRDNGNVFPATELNPYQSINVGEPIREYFYADGVLTIKFRNINSYRNFTILGTF